MKKPGDFKKSREKHLKLQFNRDQLARWRAGDKHIQLWLLIDGKPTLETIEVRSKEEIRSDWESICHDDYVVVTNFGKNRLAVGKICDKDGVGLVTNKTNLYHQQFEIIGRILYESVQNISDTDPGTKR